MSSDSVALFDSAFLAKLEQLHLLSRKIFRGQQHAERRSRQTGSSLEFADYRNYTAGDDLRTVDWNVYGRLNRLFVKLFEAEQDLHVTLLLDRSSSMGWMPPENESTLLPSTLSKYDHSRRIAAALAYVALANLDRVNVFPFDRELGADHGFVRGKQAFHSVLNFLRRMPLPSEEARATELFPAFRTFSQRMKRRGLVLVLSDLFDPQAADALAYLRQQQFEVAALQILHPCEVNPALAGPVAGDLHLLDCETGGALDLTANPTLLDSYHREFTLFHQQLEQSCRERAIGLVQTTCDLPFEDLVLKVLRDTQLVK